MMWFEVAEFVLKTVLFLIGFGCLLGGFFSLYMAFSETIKNAKGQKPKQRFIWIFYTMGILMLLICILFANLILTPWYVQ